MKATIKELKKKFNKLLNNVVDTPVKSKIESVTTEDTLTMLDVSDDLILSFERNTIKTRDIYGSRMYETYGPELQHVQENMDRAYTLIESEGEKFLVKGYHICNRLGYFLKPHAHERILS